MQIQFPPFTRPYAHLGDRAYLLHPSLAMHLQASPFSSSSPFKTSYGNFVPVRSQLLVRLG